MIKSRFGSELTIIESVYDSESGEFVACFANRKLDNQRRFYRLCDLKADDGIHEIISALESVPKHSNEEIADHETW